MLLKRGLPPSKLYYYEALTARYTLSSQQLTDYNIVKSGYQGEVDFYHLIEKYNEPVILWDINLVSPAQGEAQFDFIVIHGQNIHYYEIKNNKGIYTFNDGSLVSEYGRDFKNPFLQLKRAEKILREFVEQFDHRYHIDSYVVFINEAFHFKGDNSSYNWLFRSNLNLHLRMYKHMNTQSSINKELATHLLRYHRPYPMPPLTLKAPFETVRRGCVCSHCKKMTTPDSGRKYFVCPHCSQKILMKQLLYDNLLDLFILKDGAFTISEATEWCPYVSRSTLNRILRDHFKQMGVGKAAKYSI